MFDLTITTTGVDEALAEIDRRFSLLRENIERDLDWFGKHTTDLMVETHTFQNRTFRLEGSIDYDVFLFMGAQAHVAVFALADYASEVEFGHPGARPYPFFWPIFFAWEPVLQEKLLSSVDLALADGLPNR